MQWWLILADCIIAVAHLRTRFGRDCPILPTWQQIASSLIPVRKPRTRGPEGRTER